MERCIQTIPGKESCAKKKQFAYRRLGGFDLSKEW